MSANAPSEQGERKGFRGRWNPRIARLIRPLLYGLVITLGLFGAYEIVERLWLTGVEMHTLHLLHMLRGIFSSLIIAAVVGWMIIRTSPGFLPATPVDEACARQPRLTEAERTKDYARWFIAMRWLAVLLAAILVFASVQVMGWLPKNVWWPLASIVAALALLNILYNFLLRWERGLSVLLPLQGYLDLLVLTTLLHFSGGIENPLSMMMIFHVIIGGILLSRTQCYWIAAAASALFALLSWVEWAEVLEHYTLQLFPHFEQQGGEMFHPAHHTLYAISRVVLQAVVLLLTAYFVTTLAERLREDERRLEALAARALAGQQLLEQALEKEKQTQAQMLRAGKLAAVGELAGRVAHEVNNPIAIISAKVRLLLTDHHEEMSPKIAQELRKITDLSNRVARIAQGLLSYCRPSPATRVRLDLRQPIRKSLAMVEQHARANGVIVEDDLNEVLPPVKANAQEMEQVFLNLFLNALDAMPKGGRLKVSAASENGDVGVIATVEDTGVGIPETIRERVFEPFFTTKQEGRGTGLGLSICLGLVRSHGGEIRVESEPGRGSRFIIKLPLAEAAAAKEQVHG